VAEVVLADGKHLPADCVVVGIGVTPATDILEGVKLDERGGVIVDEYLYAGDDIYAAGDVASFPAPHTGERIRIEHWRTALQLGKIAAHNIAAGEGAKVRFEDVPFFWTRQHGKSLQYIGHAREWDEVIHDGDVAGGSFIAYYFNKGRLVAAAAMGRQDALTHIGERLRVNDLPTPAELRAGADKSR
jgi:NADPH-dependent 2,4-dienoyl-CoA reductase/sulfur reductase-like enzyme